LARKAGGKHWSEVLRYTEPKRTNRLAYLKWRKENGLPFHRCDNDKCRFFTEPLVWNGEDLPLILDHENGVNSDNRPENLRFLCPNCDSQLETKGGKNKGRVEKSAGGFALKRKDGQKAYVLPAEPGHYRISAPALQSKKSQS
jgi:hypothetical protein